jgi:hypothetical protein
MPFSEMAPVAISCGLFVPFLISFGDEAVMRKGESRSTGFYVSALSVLTVAVLLFHFTVGFQSLWIKNHFTRCQSHLKNLGTAMDMYAADNDGSYPPSMEMVTPKYLAEIPSCYVRDFSPEVWEHYRRLYGVKKGGYAYKLSDDKSTFTIYCKCSNHSQIGIFNYPQYNSVNGLTARP